MNRCDKNPFFRNNNPRFSSGNMRDKSPIQDHGPEPYVFNIVKETQRNNAFRTTLWTGEYLQMTLMNIPVGQEIGLEMHPDLDQFIRVESGHGVVKFGQSAENMNIEKHVASDYAFFVPAGTWHNLINVGNTPLKLYSLYAPPAHPKGTVHLTKADAEAAEHIH